MSESPSTPSRTWTLLTNHARLLILVARDPHSRVRDLAAQAGITERAAQGILADLEQAGFLDRRRVGRRTEYSVHPDASFRHPLEAGHEVGELLRLFLPDTPPTSRQRATGAPRRSGRRRRQDV